MEESFYLLFSWNFRQKCPWQELSLIFGHYVGQVFFQHFLRQHRSVSWKHFPSELTLEPAQASNTYGKGDPKEKDGFFFYIFSIWKNSLFPVWTGGNLRLTNVCFVRKPLMASSMPEQLWCRSSWDYAARACQQGQGMLAADSRRHMS